MQQASAGPCPAYNDNIPAPLARRVAASMAALKDFRLPDIPARSAAARAFSTFRLELMAQQVAMECGGVFNAGSRRRLNAAAGRLARAECRDALDFTIKTLALRALAVLCAVLAFRRDASALLGAAEMSAKLVNGLAADALALSATFSGQAEGFQHGR